MAWCCSTQECFQRLHEACGDAELPYHTVVWWIKAAFWEGRDAVQENLRIGWPHVENNTVQLLASLLDADHRWIAHELTAEVWVCQKTVLHILHDIPGYRKLASCWIPHDISKVQPWHHYVVPQALLDRYQREGDYFLGRIVAMDETWTSWYEPNLKCQSNEWKHPDFPRLKKVCPIQCAVKVMFIDAYDIDGVILHHAAPGRQYMLPITAHSCSTTFIQRSGENNGTWW